VTPFACKLLSEQVESLASEKPMLYYRSRMQNAVNPNLGRKKLQIFWRPFLFLVLIPLTHTKMLSSRGGRCLRSVRRFTSTRLAQSRMASDGSLVRMSAEVADSLAAGRPCVALESTIVAHGMPWPQNYEAALAVEAKVNRA